jgi:hypothetical protein
MKHLKIFIIYTGVAAISCLQLSCSKTVVDRISAVDDDFNNKSIVQVVIATVNAARNYVYVEGQPVTGAALSTGSIFPSSGYGFSVGGGLKSFLVRDTLRTSPQVPLTFAENMGAAKHYTIFMYDTITATKQKTVLDNIVVPTDTTARIRFANFIYNSSAVPAVDVYSFIRSANIFTNVPVTEVTDFISYPSRAPVDTLYVMEAGTSNLLLKVSTATLTPKRSYTFVYRGSHRGTKTSSLYASY